MTPYYEHESGELYHGDCLDIMPALADGSIDAIITDPPYGTTACKWDSVIDFDSMWSELKRLRKDRSAVVLFGSEPFSSALRMSNIKEYKYDWVWKKEKGLGFLNAKKMPLRDTENISIFYKKPSLYNPQMRKGKPYKATNKPSKQKGTNNEYKQIETVNNGTRYPLTTLKYNKEKSVIHPTQKPVPLIEYLIKTYTNENDVILDFTAGSGTTAIAAINTNRKWICIEKEKDYCDTIVDRIEQETQQLKLFATG